MSQEEEKLLFVVIVEHDEQDCLWLSTSLLWWLTPKEKSNDSNRSNLNWLLEIASLAAPSKFVKKRWRFKANSSKGVSGVVGGVSQSSLR